MPTEISGATGVNKIQTDAIEHLDLPSGCVLQVLQAMVTGHSSTTSVSFVDVSGLSISITPKSTSSKILVTADLNMGTGSGFRAHGRILRDSTALGVGTVTGSRSPSTFAVRSKDNGYLNNVSATVLDSPSTTSAITYKVQIMAEYTSGVTYVNRTFSDANNSTYPRTASMITVQEIAG